MDVLHHVHAHQMRLISSFDGYGKASFDGDCSICDCSF